MQLFPEGRFFAMKYNFLFCSNQTELKRRFFAFSVLSSVFVFMCSILFVSPLLVSCKDKDGGSADASVDGGESDGTADDGSLVDGGDIDDGSTTDGRVDGGPCEHSGELGDPCEHDCDCAEEFPCRGYPGKKVCSVVCNGYNQCSDGPLECELIAYCDLNIGACRCSCTENNCPDGVCFSGQCVGCAVDEDCRWLSCDDDPALPAPRCRPDTEECVCAGVCGDGICDEYEEATNTCPEDCTGPCENGQTLPFSCMNGTVVEWCRCENEIWVCNENPTQQCEGDTECEQAGGNCVSQEDHCYEGVIAADAMGCTGDMDLCCVLPSCVGIGEHFYPVLGHCCPGLRALPPSSPSEGMIPGVEGIMCFASCWIMTCSTCGDGICQPQYSENFCNCPEDCPPPPYEMACSSVDRECGLPFCRQEAGGCEEHVPKCSENSCSWSVEVFPGSVCDGVKRRCVSL